ncbi:MAG: KpsF/GutQ family sugar-phosphate isomerase [Rickettsiaceae bacterium]|nr:KpsF/GutQ family sugar-phosphate isomerase [Rickettsiaceae bacterium]
MEKFNKVASEVIDKEIEGLMMLQKNMPNDFGKAANAIAAIPGRLIVSGIGKSGYIGQKISASFASTGTRSFYVHPAEASHGDLGMIGEGDIVLLLSNSGQTKELIDIIEYCKKINIPIIGMTMSESSLLANSSTYLLNLPKIQEASSVNAPTTSTTMMIALGDALVVSVHESKGFSRDEFAIFHPGGQLGASLAKVSTIMHAGSKIPIVSPNCKVSDAILEMTSKGFGCTAVIENDNVIGIITDGDLRRNMSPTMLSDPAKTIMTPSPILIGQSATAIDALNIMNNHKVTSLFVVDENKLTGIIHIHDLIRLGLKPDDQN